MDTSKLSKKELKALHSLLGKLINDEETPVETAPKKRGRPKKLVEKVETTKEVPLEDLRKAKKKLKKKKVEPLSVERKIAKKRGGEKAGQVLARTLPLTVPKGGRPNLFLKMEDFHAHKEDTKIDKKLWGRKKPAPRGTREIELVEIACRVCEDICEVRPEEISPEGQYVCNECIVSGELAEGEDVDGDDND